MFAGRPSEVVPDPARSTLSDDRGIDAMPSERPSLWLPDIVGWDLDGIHGKNDGATFPAFHV
jgi:hypothetical protein